MPPRPVQVRETPMDRLSASRRSANMARIHGVDTRPEMIVRRSLYAAGCRYRLHAPDLPGRPDIVLRRQHTAILVHGCFWHRHPGCAFAYETRSRQEFWRLKFSANVDRDHRNIKSLQNDGWKVIVVWECGLRGASRTALTLEQLRAVLSLPRQGFHEVPIVPYPIERRRKRNQMSQTQVTVHGKHPTYRTH